MTTPNEKQLEAINAPIDANIRVLAPPGAGKTFAIQHRYKHMVDNGIDPDNILVVTFSKSMADEMGQRIASTCPSANLEQISTIHAFCFRVLTKWYDDSLYLNWSVPKEWEVKKTLNEAIEKIWLIDEKPGYKEVLYWIDNSKHNGLVSGDALPYFQEHLGQQYGQWLYSIRKWFDGWLRKRRALTFSDMLFLMEHHLKTSGDFRSKLQAKFPYLIIDEAHDTNSQALSILLMICKYSMSVSDVDQMMYRFQGAKPEIMTSDYAPNLITIKFDKNYRSTSNIIESCQTLISYNYSEKGGPYSQEFAKDVSGIRDNGQAIHFQMVDTIEDEAQLVADTILEQCENGYNFGDFFVGARTRSQLGYYEGALLKAGIKFINLCGGSFWQSKHVADVIGYLRLANDTSNKDAFKQVYNIASANNTDKHGKYLNHRWLGQEFLKITDSSFKNIWKAPERNRRYYYGVTDLSNFVDDIQDEIHHSERVDDIIQFILDNCYLKWLEADEGIVTGDEAENGKLEDFNTVLEIASKYNNIEEFLGFVDEAIKQAEDAKNGDWSQYTVISSYHRLKGLERPVMIGTGWCEGFQIRKVGGEEVREPRGLLPHTFSLVPPPQFGVLPTGNQSPVPDERCIGFVGISRAKDKVFLSGCRGYRKWQLEPSRFIRELGIETQ